MTSPTRIGIAVVEHQGTFLVGTRGAESPLAGFAEFPGGKCRTDESTADCACRECLEETGLAVRTIRLLEHVQHTYPHGEFVLEFWLCEPIDKASVSDEHRGFSWVPAHQLAECRFPDANASVIELLIENSFD